ncbi:MAG: glycosyltransferase [Prolixibacteraceae bacterium]|jgi:glycosyltransferase involved in cell wall biosynthesis
MLRKIKIIGTAYPFRGGLAAYNERLAKEFINQGFEVEIETFTIQYPKLLFPGKTQLADWEAPEGLTIKRTINSVNPFNWLVAGIRIRKEKPDLVIFKYWLPFMAPCFGTLIRIIHKNKHTKVISIADNIVPHEKRIGDKLLTAYFMNSIDGMVAMSKSVFNDIFLFRSNLPADLCPHPLFDNFGEKLSRETALKMLKLDPSYNYMLFFGFIRDYKGLDLLIHALNNPELKAMPLKLIVAGEFYTDPRPYFDLIERLGLADKILMINKFIADHEVNTYFCASDIVVQPYKHATQSGVTQIGYHFDKPMLVTNVGALAEIIPDQKVGYVVEPVANEISLALIDYYLNNRKAEFEAYISEEKKKFLWSKMTDTIIRVFNQTNKK